MYFVELGRRAEARERLIQTAGILKREFPEIVQSWGGETALLERRVVSTIAEKLGIQTTPAEPDSSLADSWTGEVPRLDNTRRRKFADLVQQLIGRQEQAVRYAPRRPFPLVLALLLGALVGTGAGIGAGFLFYAFRGPVGVVIGNQRTYHNYRGHELSPPVFRVENQRMIVFSILIGIGVGLAVCVLVARVLARRPWYRGQLLSGLALGAVLGGAVGGGAAALYDQFFAPFREMENNRLVEYDRQGRKFDSFVEYVLQNRDATAIAAVVGVALGVAIAITVSLLFQRWYHGRATEARQEMDQVIAQIDENFPEVVITVGGREALRSRKLAKELLTSAL